jgi:predicted small lipoprotein YifL
VPRRYSTLIALTALAAASVAGCGSKGPTTVPVACAGAAEQYLTALRAAPDTVRLAEDTPISDCFTGDESPEVGRAVIEAASRLNAQARRDPGGNATVQLGYLAGAVHEGTSHVPSEADLVRRLDSAARYNPGGGSPGAAFERMFGKGYAAGEATG